MINWFIDTSFLIALTLGDDRFHSRAQELWRQFKGKTIFTSDEVLAEYMNYFSNHGRHFREIVVRSIELIQNSRDIIIFPQTRDSFVEGFELYRSRLDKGYSHTDCVSMCHLRRQRITEVLTSDRHFKQAGFTILMER